MLQFLDTTAAPAAGGGMASTLVMLVLMIAIFYFMLIRPENKRKKEAEQMRSALKVGDKITTIGGITGTVVNVKDDKFVIETGAFSLPRPAAGPQEACIHPYIKRIFRINNHRPGFFRGGERFYLDFSAFLAALAFALASCAFLASS